MEYGNDNKTVIADFFNVYQFTNQTQRELSEWIPEIAYRENVSVSDIINGNDVQSILHCEKLNAPQKAQKIRDILYRMRFPEYSKLQERWKKNTAAVNPKPSKVRFIHSPGFEKKRIEVKVTAESAEEAREIFKSLSEIPLHMWDDIIYPQ